MALFITFEGGEGSGKSTQIRTLYRRLEQLAIAAVLIREPGGTLLGDRIRYILKQACEVPISPLSELLLFNASRSQLVKEVIQPALNESKVVLCDRFTDSTIAYQSFGRGLELATVIEANTLATQAVRPDLTFLLDVPPDIGLKRKGQGLNDRFEQEAIDFHRKVREGFLKLAAEEPERWTVIDSTLSREQMASIIWEKVRARLSA
jgi:dTMP kinase